MDRACYISYKIRRHTTIITDPVFSKNAGPLIFGPKRFTEPALTLREIPPVDLFLLNT